MWGVYFPATSYIVYVNTQDFQQFSNNMNKGDQGY